MSVTNPASGMPTDEQKKQIEGWINNLPKCGCGRVGRYETQSGLACNKYMRCDNTEFLAEQNQQLQAKNAELEAENAKLHEQVDLQVPKMAFTQLKEQLAAAQEENGRLENQVLARDAELWGRTQEILGLKDQLANAEQRVAEACALYIHSTKGAVGSINMAEAVLSGEWRKFVKEAVSTQKEYYESVFQDGTKRIANLTRQRDLAVDALESCVRDDDGCIASAIRTIDTIKESEEN